MNVVAQVDFRYGKEWSANIMAQKVTIPQKYQVWI
jgi:hypothetical protein